MSSHLAIMAGWDAGCFGPDVFQAATGIKVSAVFSGLQNWVWPRWSLMVPWGAGPGDRI